MSSWRTIAVRNGTSVIEATIPSMMDSQVLQSLSDHLTIPRPCLTTNQQRVADLLIMVPAAGAKLISRYSRQPFRPDDLDCHRHIFSRVDRFRTALRIRKKAPLPIREMAACLTEEGKKHAYPRKTLVCVERYGNRFSYAPPPPQIAGTLINDAIQFIDNNKSTATTLSLACYAYAQVVAIHPLVDGNGRLARACFLRILGTDRSIQAWGVFILSLLYSKFLHQHYAAIMRYCLDGNLNEVAENINMASLHIHQIISNEAWKKLMEADINMDTQAFKDNRLFGAVNTLWT